MSKFHALVFASTAIVSVTICLESAHSTEGYFQHGYGARHKAIGGAGVADASDATAAALNPAGLVNVDDQLNLSLTVFNPSRGTIGTGQPGLTPNAKATSGGDYFFVPNFAISRRLQNNPLIDVIGLTLYANGGLNSQYADVPGSTTCQALFGLPAAAGGPIGTGSGLLCNGKAGVNLEQAFLSFAMAKRFGKVSIGLAPILARQTVEVEGLQLFAGFSSAPRNVSNRGLDESYGYGIRAGIEYELTPDIRLGIAGNSRIYMSRFKKYRGLFAENGDFDVPPSLQLGIAVDLLPNFTVMFDYKRIWYSHIAALSNSSDNLLSAGTSPENLLGATNGAGFGWDDINIIKVGAEWQATDDLTLRLGYAYNEKPFGSQDSLVNVVAPAIVQHHFTAGAHYTLSDTWQIEVEGFYVPEARVSGSELSLPTPLGTIGNSAHQIGIFGKGVELSLSLTKKW